MDVDDHFDIEDEEYAASDNSAVPVVKPTGKFSDETLAVLKSLYKKGMVGWGRSHADQVKEAVSITGLQLDQVKVFKFLH